MLPATVLVPIATHCPGERKSGSDFERLVSEIGCLTLPGKLHLQQQGCLLGGDKHGPEKHVSGAVREEG